MKYHGDLIASCSLGFCIGVVLSGCSSRKSVVQQQVDLGLLVAGTKVERVFNFKNDSSEPWAVAAVQKSCNCAETRVRHFTPPGEILQVPVALLRDDPGTFGVSVTVVMTNGVHVRALLVGEVHAPVHLVPASLAFDGGRPCSVQVKAPSHLPPPILSLETGELAAESFFDDWVRSDGFWQCNLTVVPRGLEGGKEAGYAAVKVGSDGDAVRLPLPYTWLSANCWEPAPKLAIVRFEQTKAVPLLITIDSRGVAPSISNMSAFSDGATRDVSFHQLGRKIEVDLRDFLPGLAILTLTDEMGSAREMYVDIGGQ